MKDLMIHPVGFLESPCLSDKEMFFLHSMMLLPHLVNIKIKI